MTKNYVCLLGTAFVLAALFSSCGEKLPVYPDAQFDLRVSEQRQTHTFVWDYVGTGAGTGAGASASGLSCKEQVDGYPLVVTSWNKVVIKATSTDPHFQGVSVSSSDGSKVAIRTVSSNEYELVYSSDTDRKDTQVNYDTPEWLWAQKTWTKSDYTPGLVTITVSAGSFSRSFKVAARESIPLDAIRFKTGDPFKGKVYNYYATLVEPVYAENYNNLDYLYTMEDQYSQDQAFVIDGDWRECKKYPEDEGLQSFAFQEMQRGDLGPYCQIEDPWKNFGIVWIDNLVPENASWRNFARFSNGGGAVDERAEKYFNKWDNGISFDPLNRYWGIGLPDFCVGEIEESVYGMRNTAVMKDVDFSALKGRLGPVNLWREDYSFMIEFIVKNNWREGEKYVDSGNYPETLYMFSVRNWNRFLWPTTSKGAEIWVKEYGGDPEWIDILNFDASKVTDEELLAESQPWTEELRDKWIAFTGK